jgi:hypothetical protein
LGISVAAVFMRCDARTFLSLVRLMTASLALFSASYRISAADSDIIGIQLLRQSDPSLDGNGVPVALVEAGAPYWEANPGAIGIDANRISYSSGDGSAMSFPNLLGTESPHANTVGSLFFGLPQGMAPNVSRVYNYEASFFYQNMVVPGAKLPARIVNQSFVFPELSAGQQELINRAYNDTAVDQNVLFITGVGNTGRTAAPATAHNGLAVATFGGNSAVGPTLDSERCKPDLAAPAGVSSLAAPLAAGAATLLLQAAERGYAGQDTATAAGDSRTLKALLLNGAVKPGDWTGSSGAPLDARYGAGVVNVFNSCRQLWAGRQSPDTGNTSTNRAGWDLNTITNKAGQDTVRRYSFVVPAQEKAVMFSATLAWSRALGAATQNNLDLELFHQETGRLVLVSTSRVDNAEHVFAPRLSPGTYQVRVIKRGDAAGQSSASETYALAYAADSVALRVEPVLGGVLVSWPAERSGLTLEASSGIGPGATWTRVDEPVGLINGRQAVRVSVGTESSVPQFFRLAPPRI